MNEHPTRDDLTSPTAGPAPRPRRLRSGFGRRAAALAGLGLATAGAGLSLAGALGELMHAYAPSTTCCAIG